MNKRNKLRILFVFVLLIAVFFTLHTSTTKKTEFRQHAAVISNPVGSLGRWNVAIVLVNFQDNTSQPVNPQQAIAKFTTNADSLNTYFKTVSFGKFSIGGKNGPNPEVYGYITLPYSNDGSCNYPTWHTSANALVRQRYNVDLSSAYDFIVYAYPPRSGCPGLAWSTGSVIDILDLQNALDLHVLAHEVGHSLGLGHTYYYRCKDASGKPIILGRNCSTNWQVAGSGDYYDPMGHIYSNHYNIYHLLKLGWIDRNNLQTVTQSGEYTILPLEKAMVGVQAIRVPRGIESGDQTYIYLHFRRPLTQFDNFSEASPVIRGISMHLGKEIGRDISDINFEDVRALDAVPETMDENGGKDSSLQVGKIMYDEVSKITIETVAVGSEGAKVRITFPSTQNTIPTATPRVIPTVTPSVIPTVTPSVIPTVTPSVIPTVTPRVIPTVTPFVIPTASGNGLSAVYYINYKADNTVTRIDQTIDFDWNIGSPGSGIPADNFLTRWTGYVVPKYSQIYTFYTQSDDGIRLWVNGRLIINNWTYHSVKENRGFVSLIAGRKYPIKIEYFEGTGDAVVKLFWSSSSTPKQIIPQSRLYAQ